MKLLIIPIIIALFAGIGGGSGYAYMRASKKFTADSAQRADSLKAHPPKPHADEDSTANEPELHDIEPDSAEHAEEVPTTPADSLRALATARSELKQATKGLHDATPSHDAADHGEKPTRGEKPSRDVKPEVSHAEKSVAGHAAKPEASHEVKGEATHAAAQEKRSTAIKSVAPKTEAAHDAKPADTHAAADTHADAAHGVKPEGASSAAAKHSEKPGAPSTGAVAAALRGARNDAMATPLPEQRLAKIFGAMQAKEASKVMDQMNDDDVRSILGMMSDRQAAAILATFPAARAAAIARGASRTPDIKP